MGFHSMINRIPQKVSGRVPAASSVYVPQDNIWQWAIGGTPLLSATDPQMTDVESTVEQRKQQFDNYKDPGEYSLDQWWLRSQSEFNGGEGITYQDPDTQETYLVAKNTRYDTGLGVDPFTDYSELQLLPEVNQSSVYPSTLDSGKSWNTYVQSFTDPTGNDAFYLARGNTVYVAGLGASDITLTHTVALATDGGAYGITGGLAFTGASQTTVQPTGFVYQDQAASGHDGVWAVTSAGVATNIYAGDSTHNRKTLAFVKGQLTLASGQFVYLLPNLTGTRTALPAASATLPAGQYVVSMTEGPDGLYVAANNGSVGYIYKATYDSTLSTINGLEQIAVLPEGEQLNTIAFYVGTYLLLATDKGARVASVDNTGISYGPLIFSFPKKLPGTNGCRGISFFGSLAYFGVYSSTTATHDGAWGLYCVDLGTVNDDTVTGFSTNAYCRWSYSPNTLQPIHDLSISQTGRVVYSSVPATATTQSLLWVEHASNVISSGYFQTGRCRYNTLEQKLFKYFSIRSPLPLLGSVNVGILDQGGGFTDYITYTADSPPGITDVATPIPYGPQDWIKLKITLLRSATDTTVGGTINGWQIKAMPGTVKQRQIVKWFNCYNNQQDQAGQQIGNDTYAYDLLSAVRIMCQRSDTVIFQDLINNTSTLVVIDDYKFVMTAPPGPNGENYGGFLMLQMRTVADTVPPIPASAGIPID